MKGINAGLVIGLTATLLAVPVAGQDQTRLCLTVTPDPGSGLGSPVMVRNGITSGLIEVVSVDECVPEAGLDALSDAEHFGVLVGHMLGTAPTLTALMAEPVMAPHPAPARDWLAELAADPEAFTAYLAVGDRLMAVLEDELTWMQAHPPRPCSAQLHEAIVDWYGGLAVVWRETLAALRAQDGDRFGHAYQELKLREAREFPDPFSLGLTCWQLGE